VHYCSFCIELYLQVYCACYSWFLCETDVPVLFLLTTGAYMVPRFMRIFVFFCVIIALFSQVPLVLSTAEYDTFYGAACDGLFSLFLHFQQY